MLLENDLRLRIVDINNKIESIFLAVGERVILGLKVSIPEKAKFIEEAEIKFNKLNFERKILQWVLGDEEDLVAEGKKIAVNKLERKH